ncbi:unnamed protein product [Candidula unifasciata]|uniref:MD-2-related lipid-recognition domain-containing protein n=1 Tax=Candidula unifasciata TaxID=100452 RepID=A0A8S3Z2G9_9EUPU|nr:unnamed protein product [Candidula unifasciata]
MMKLLLVVLCVAYASSRDIKLVEEMSVVNSDVSSENDFGVFTNCGKSQLSGMWTPKVISTHGQVTVDVNFTAPYDMDGGFADVAVYRHADHVKVVEYGTPFSCEEIVKYIPCPLKKGQVITLHNTIPDLSQLSGYQGVFDIETYVNNDDDQQLLCVRATVTVTR